MTVPDSNQSRPGDGAAAIQSSRLISARRLATRSLVGVLSRGAQGALLAVAVLLLPPTEASDMAVSLAACTVLNLVSNAGIPTLLVRHRRQGSERVVLLALLRAYVLLTSLAAVAMIGLLLLFTGRADLTSATTVLLVSQSLFSGAEYWALAKGSDAYDRFVGRVAAFQALLGIGAIPALVLSRSDALSLATLASSYLIPLVVANVRRLRSHAAELARSPRVAPRFWVRDASVIASGTVAASLFYAADVAVLQANWDPEALASYRLAVTLVAFLTGMVPLGMFLLADVSAGHVTAWRGPLTLISLSTAFAGLLGVLAPLASDRYESAGGVLLVMLPLVSLRILSQVLASEFHARGLHRDVAMAYVFGLAWWIVAGASVSWAGVSSLRILAIVHVSLEALVLIFMCFRFRVRQGDLKRLANRP